MAKSHLFPVEASEIRRQKLKTLLESETLYGSVLLTLCADTWGQPEPDDPDRTMPFLRWHPNTLRLEIDQEFGVQLPQPNFDKLMATVAIITTDLFFQKADRFIALTAALSTDSFEPDVFSMVDVADCAWSVTEAFLLHPPDTADPEPFSDEVRALIGFLLREEGFLRPPGILGIALDADQAAQVQYEYADDPELFAGVWGIQEDKAKEVEAGVKDGLLELLKQLKALPLRHGNTDELERRVRATLGETIT